MVAFIHLHPDVFQRELFSGMCASAALFKLVRQLLMRDLLVWQLLAARSLS